jgi:hypothetical protein
MVLSTKYIKSRAGVPGASSGWVTIKAAARKQNKGRRLPTEEEAGNGKTTTSAPLCAQSRTQIDSMFVLYTAVLWSLPFVGFPYALVALALGRAGDVAALVAFYLAFGAFVTRLTQPKPLGAQPADVPHLTLCHPHGILTTGFGVLITGDRAWNARRRAIFGPPHFLAASIWPFLDFWMRCCGCRCSSPSRASVGALMRANKDVYLFPGGFLEAARHDHRKDVVDVGSRGAIRLALTHGYAVRVCFAFGERDTAYNLQGWWGPRLWLAKRGIPAVVPFLRLWAPAPRVALSPTIQLPLVDAPTDADVERWHGAYVAALRELHERFKRPGDELVVHDGCVERARRAR